MDYVNLGKTGIMVSRFAFGTLTMGSLQRNLPVEAGASLIRQGLERGITFIDGAQAYGTYGHIREALKGYGGDVVIATKSSVDRYDLMVTAVEEARRELGRDVIDVFLLHAVQREDDLQKRRDGAWQVLLEMKAKGVIRAIGLSTHNLDIVEKAAAWPDIDVIHPIFNKVHFGLINPFDKNPEAVMQDVYEKGIGVYAMKPLAGGHMFREAPAALRYVFNFPYIHCAAVGMVKQEELDVNLKLYYGQDVSEEELQAAATDKKMYVSKFCAGCGECIDICEQGAIQMVDEKAYIEFSQCILCGYCRKTCPKCAIRII